MDIALAIEALLGLGVKYFGSTTDNTKEAFDNLTWRDVRLKPKWEELLIKWEEIKDNFIYKTKIEELEERLSQLEEVKK